MTISVAELHARAGVQDDHSAASASHGHVTAAGVVEWHSHTPARDAFNCPHYPQGCVAAGAPRCRCLADADANGNGDGHTPPAEPRADSDPAIRETDYSEAKDTEPPSLRTATRPMPDHDYPTVSDD